MEDMEKYYDNLFKDKHFRVIKDSKKIKKRS